jgi:drug/metabolite transporter (DMT)-like permease
MADGKMKRLASAVLLISVVLNAAGQIFFKAAQTNHPEASLLELFFQPEIWIALSLYGFSSVAWIWVLSRAQLSFAYPVLALSFPVVVAFSALLFSETVTGLRWLGVGTIVAGVSLMARS